MKGIYILTSPSGRSYVGKSVVLRTRVSHHLAGNSPATRLIHRAVKKYGRDAFLVQVIEYPGISDEALYAVEQWYISKLGTLAPHGYNLRDSGMGRSTFRHSDDTKRKMSLSAQRQVGPNKGRTFTAEHRRRISESCRGRVGGNKRKSNPDQLFLFDVD